MDEETSLRRDVSVEDGTKAKADVKEMNGELAEEEVALDREFVKVEQDSIDVKEGSLPIGLAGGDPALTLRSFGGSGRELLETQEKVKELELELERVAESLKETESENVALKEEVLSAKEKLETSKKAHEELEIGHDKLQEKVTETEHKYDVQVRTFEEASRVHEVKEREFAGVKEAFDSLQLELGCSQKRSEDLEKELVSSTKEAQKFEDLHKQSGLRADSQTRKALEFERLLTVAKESAKEMESQMCALQGEIKGLYERIAEGLKVEEALARITAENSILQQELALTKSKAEEFEESHSSKESTISELQQELDSVKALEAHVQREFTALRDDLGSVKEDLREKVMESEEMKIKLHEETSTRETYERHIKAKEAEFLTVQERLASMISENEALQAMKDLSTKLEDKLKMSEENFLKASSLLSETLASNAEVEEKLKSLEARHCASGAEAQSASQKNLELESLIQELEGEKERAKSLMEGYQEKISSLEGSFSLLSSRNAELEEELKSLAGKCIEHEDRANRSHQRSLELEDIIQVSHSKAEDAGKKVAELELLLEADKYQIQELEEQLSGLQKKLVEVGGNSKKFSDRTSELTSELEEYQRRSSSLEVALQTAEEKEQELTRCLDAASEEKKELEKALSSTSMKLGEAENLLELLRNDLSLTRHSLETLESDHKAVGIREAEALEKLKRAEERIKELQEQVAEYESKSSMLLSDDERLVETNAQPKEVIIPTSRVKDLEQKLQTAGSQPSPEKESAGGEIKAREEEVSRAATPLKFVVAVALVSVLVGVILGKSY